MPLAILTIRKELHGFLFLCIRVVPFSIIMGLRLAALRAAGAPLLSFLFGNLRRDVLIEARERKKASGQDRWESHFHADSALDSCRRCHFLLTNHKGGTDLQFVDRAGWVSSPVLTNKLFRRERRGAFVVSTTAVKIKDLQTSWVLLSFLKGTNSVFGT